ncbi:MAG: hypothetical protein IH851_03795, partial [Armatimonadetes bacterium]|nr:hypothetical protein [Armatimonadota bacterium]
MKKHKSKKQTPEELSKNGGKTGKKGNTQGDTNKKGHQPKFLSVLAEKGIVTDACLAIGVSRKTA